MAGLRNHRADNVLHQHSVLHHQAEPLGTADFKLEVTSRHKVPLSRQAEEGTRILLELASKTEDHPNLYREGEKADSDSPLREF